MTDVPPAGACPCCGSGETHVFHRVPRIPVNSTVQLTSVEEALSFPRGDMDLAACDLCGFVYNASFDSALIEYSSRCEETQSFSPVFSGWQRGLAASLVERHGLHGREVVEIGCGKGEFLNALCEIGDNRGIGFDPAYVPERNDSPARDRIEFVREFYTADNAPDHGDFLVCKMTLEHIPRVAEFVSMVRASVGERLDTAVFFQVPDAGRVLEETAFWDVYYEHCSYFGAATLGGLFRHSGFEVTSLQADYGGQYLMLEARPSAESGIADPDADAPIPTIGGVKRFERRVGRLMDEWRARLANWRERGRTVAVWGSGSKGVAFLTSLGVKSEVAFVVDVNPHRAGHFMAGTGHRIVEPSSLPENPPDTVVLMNPVYRDEVQSTLDGMGLTSVELLAVTDAGTGGG